MKDAVSNVLIVEADIIVRHPLAQYLRECGFRVFEAANSDEARSILSQSQPGVDVVLVDMASAGGGFTLRHWIQEQQLDVDVILAGSITKAVSEAGELCQEGPALHKPYEHKLVLDRIRQSIAQRDARRGNSGPKPDAGF